MGDGNSQSIMDTEGKDMRDAMSMSMVSDSPRYYAGGVDGVSFFRSIYKFTVHMMRL